MICDDSPTVRGILARLLEVDPEIEVVARVADGQQALNVLGEAQPDVVLLDLEMPVMDGMTALPKLLRADSRLAVIVASAVTQRGAAEAMAALRAGASDYIPKPGAGQGGASDPVFRAELLEKVKGWARMRRRTAAQASSGVTPSPAITPTPQAAPNAPPQANPALPSRGQGGEGPRGVTPLSAPGIGRPPVRSAPVAPIAPNRASSPTQATNGRPPQPPLRSIKPRSPQSAQPPVLLAVGSSTGGPQALAAFLRGLTQLPPVPVVIVQHMPAGFTAMLADHLDRLGPLRIAEAKEAEGLRPGHVYVAPGDRHLLVERGSAGLLARLRDDSPEHFCRPAVDPMLRSAVQSCEGRVLAVILTGMGQDGFEGCRSVVAAGGTVFAQDEASSVVWGMPGAVVRGGLAQEVLPPERLGARASAFLAGAGFQAGRMAS
ncbi:chemotaxis-specific protein-glutamate methyltransferase CheB [Roseomonas sp. KE2513]|nr:chemotaxis-specific protein-glutamate methyltransferase CheB [Roseomonas sp. KE2513]